MADTKRWPSLMSHDVNDSYALWLEPLVDDDGGMRHVGVVEGWAPGGPAPSWMLEPPEGMDPARREAIERLQPIDDGYNGGRIVLGTLDGAAVMRAFPGAVLEDVPKDCMVRPALHAWIPEDERESAAAFGERLAGVIGELDRRKVEERFAAIWNSVVVGLPRIPLDTALERTRSLGDGTWRPETTTLLLIALDMARVPQPPPRAMRAALDAFEARAFGPRLPFMYEVPHPRYQGPPENAPMVRLRDRRDAESRAGGGAVRIVVPEGDRSEEDRILRLGVAGGWVAPALRRMERLANGDVSRIIPEDGAGREEQPVLPDDDGGGGTRKHEDVGEVLVGARKHWSGTLTSSDVSEMPDEQKVSDVKKANLWPPMDYAALREAGYPDWAVLAVKYIRDAVASVPVKGFTPRGRIDPTEKPDDIQKYAEMVQFLREHCEAFLDMALEEAPEIDEAETEMDRLDRRTAFLSDHLSGLMGDLLVYVNLDRIANRIIELQPEIAEEARNHGIVLSPDSPPEKNQAVRFLNEAVREERFHHGWGPRDVPVVLGKKLNDWMMEGRFTFRSDVLRKAVIRANVRGWDAITGRRGKRRRTDDIPYPPHLERIEREGPDWRGGRDVGGDDLLRVFGFRGIQYGNWVPQKERQAVLNHAYDALMDLSDLLGFPPECIGLGGRLGLAFGARGHGGRKSARAHYEPGTRVINLTRISGAGSLGHEWLHAFDDHVKDALNEAVPEIAIGRDRLFTDHMMDRHRKATPKWMIFDADMTMQAFEQRLVNRLRQEGRPETDALADVVSSLAAIGFRTHFGSTTNRKGRTAFRCSRFRADAWRIDNGVINKYWSKPCEMFARSFQAWLSDTLREKGRRSDYLEYGSEEDRFSEPDAWRGNPFPSGEERERLNEEYDLLAARLSEYLRTTANNQDEEASQDGALAQSM